MRRRQFIQLFGGAAAAWPLPARAQQSSNKIPVVGVLWHAGSAEEEGPYFKALIEGFETLGYAVGRNIELEHRFPNEIPEQFKKMAAELAALKVDVLMSVGYAASVQAKDATATVPVVFLLVPDPVGSKLVKSLARPGGNVTGLTNVVPDLIGKRLQVVKEATPTLTRVALLVNPNFPDLRLDLEKTAKAAAVGLGLTIQTFDARSIDELDTAFDAMATAGMQVVVVNPGGVAFQGRAIIPKLAIARGLALCAYSRETFAPGAFISYGTDQTAICRRAAVYVEKILKGKKPDQLPVEEPTKFELLINLKTAKALGVTVPPFLIARADEVIE